MEKTINPKETARAKKSVFNGNFFENRLKKDFGLVDHRGNSPDFVARDSKGKTHFIEAKFHGELQDRALVTLKQLKRVNSYNDQKVLEDFSKKKAHGKSVDALYVIRLNGNLYWVPAAKIEAAVKESTNASDGRVVKTSRWGMNEKSRRKADYYEGIVGQHKKVIEEMEKEKERNKNSPNAGEIIAKADKAIANASQTIADCTEARNRIVAKHNRAYIRLTEEQLREIAVKVDVDKSKKEEAKKKKKQPSLDDF